jgi:hypothetical protein
MSTLLDEKVLPYVLGGVAVGALGGLVLAKLMSKGELRR